MIALKKVICKNTSSNSSDSNNSVALDILSSNSDSNSNSSIKKVWHKGQHKEK